MAKKKRKKDDGIEISPKHGLNPSLDLCFWCRKPRGIALLGRLRKKDGGNDDAEAPKHTLSSLEPCDECKAKFEKGVHLIEVSDDGSAFDNNRAFALGDTEGKPHWPTGRFLVLNPEVMNGVKAGDRMLMTHEVMEMLIKRMDDAERRKAEEAKKC